MPKMKKYKKRSKSQKLYKMKGCSNKTCKKRGLKYLGGSHKNFDIKNAYPNPGPPSNGFNFLNPQTGGCGEQCSIHMKGGSCGCNKNRMNGGNNSLPYPNGLLGNAWTPSVTGWPGVDGISMNRNHLGYNTYTNDISRQMRDVGPAPPYTYLKGGKKKIMPVSLQDKIIDMQNNEKHLGVNNSFSPIERRQQLEQKTIPTIRIKNKTQRKKHKRGGNMSNFIGQDLLNLGRQFQYGVGSTYNAIRGYAAPVNPLPWKDQLTK